MSAYSSWLKSRRLRKRTRNPNLLKSILSRNLIAANQSTRLSPNSTKSRKTDRQTVASSRLKKNAANLSRKRSSRDLRSLKV